ncbi:MAG TPA: hypothetical protein PLY00_18130, partial [Verrucomicrobiota bacterium]|nr:hypothetical protein [Planctomycetota bacterium]HOR73178.1 hypothetical protein [Verrucomicrobiota bacterium]
PWRPSGFTPPDNYPDTGGTVHGREEAALSPAAWAHTVDIEGSKLHYHKRATELYYVLEGGGSVILDGVEDFRASPHTPRAEPVRARAERLKSSRDR